MPRTPSLRLGAVCEDSSKSQKWEAGVVFGIVRIAGDVSSNSSLLVFRTSLGLPPMWPFNALTGLESIVGVKGVRT